MSDGFNSAQKQELKELFRDFALDIKQEVKDQADITKREIRDEMDFKLKGLEQRMDAKIDAKLDAKLDAKIGALAVDMAEQFDHVLNVMEEGFGRIGAQEKITADHEVRISKLEIQARTV